jgi:hypothetical protein
MTPANFVESTVLAETILHPAGQTYRMLDMKDAVSKNYKSRPMIILQHAGAG